MINTYTGKNLEDALSNAAQSKNCTTNQLIYTVTEEKKGILGIGASTTISAYTLNDVKEFLFNYIGEFFLNLDVEVEIEISIDSENEFKINLNCENNARLIGHNGKTLNALNTVVKGAVKNSFKKYYSILIDVNHYRQKKYDRLTKLAIRTAKNVRNTKVDVVLDPMSNDERKVIHQALSNFKHIKTESFGEGKERRLKIMYKEANQ